MFETHANTESPLQQSALNFVADALWEDFKAERPIDGGVTFEIKLRQCRLDGSLGSLRRLDKFLLSIRSQISVPATAFVHDHKNLNLLWFIGFYAGNILAKAWKSTPNWLGRYEIKNRYPSLDITDDNPFTHVALNYLPKSQHTTAEYKHLFFVLEPIGKILFADLSKPMISIAGTEVESSLFDAVVKRLPEQMRQKVMAMQAKVQAKEQAAAKLKQADNIIQQSQSERTEVNKPTPQTVPKQVINSAESSKSSVSAGVSTLSSAQATQPKSAEAATQNNQPDPLIRQDDFTSLRAELIAIDAPLTQGNRGVKEYQQATKVLDKFDKYIAKSVRAGVDIDNVSFSPQQQKARMQALKLLNQSAQLGNSSAMLKLSIYYFLGEGVVQDASKGFAWVQKAANDSDVRAQRQMSRLYYQGLGKEQDVEAGRYWLEKAAENGHQEAQTLMEHWNNSQIIMSEHRFEQSVNQRYLILGAMLAVILLLVIVLV